MTSSVEQTQRVLALAASYLFAAAVPAQGLLGIPPFPVEPSQRAEAVEIGRRLFADKRLSILGDTSCATCHDSRKRFTDGKPMAQTTSGPSLVRNTPSLLNVQFLSTLFWDGRVSSLTKQALLPLTGSAEHGLANSDAVVAIVGRDSEYRAAFQHAMGVRAWNPNIDDILDALAAYEKTLVAGDSPFDRFEYGNESKAMSEAAIRGLSLFRGRAMCVTCHTIGEHSALFTDQQFHNSPLGLPKKTSERLDELADRVFELKSRGATSELNRLVETDAGISALGRFVVTLNPKDIGKFRTPPLRDVALTAPYMHDGSVGTLSQAIELELYSRADRGHPFAITQDEKADILQLLLALTSRE